jgi:flagellar biosynthesis chaperone FliJ
MAVSRGLGRLLKVRLLEEEQCRIALETAVGHLHRLEHARAFAGERERRGRQIIHQAIQAGELPDRIAGIEEERAALRQAAMLEAAIPQSREFVHTLRETYLSARIERRQVETLINEAKAAEALDADRRGQQALDDMYGSRRQVAEAARKRASEKLEGK